jgi:hypothetical protein
MALFARNFIRLCLICLLLGFVLGLEMVIHPGAVIYRPIHVHLLLIGFMSNMVFGVAYHILPRFQGHVRIPDLWAALHLHLAGWGLLAMVVGWIARLKMAGSPLAHLLLVGGIAECVGVLIFLVIIMRGLVPNVPKGGN